MRHLLQLVWRKKEGNSGNDENDGMEVDWRTMITSPKAYRGLDESSDH